MPAPSPLVLLTLLLALPAAGEDLPGRLDWRRVATIGAGEEREARTIPPWRIRQGSFTLATGMADDPELVCFYATPEPAPGQRESPRRGDALYVFHTPNPGARNILDNGIGLRVVAESGMTAFGISFQRSSDYALFLDPQRRDRFFASPRSGSFTAVLAAWAKLRSLLGIDQERFFVYGYSAGGIAAQHLAEDQPQACAGVVVANGHSFIQERHATCPFLIIHTVGDGGEAPGDGLAIFCREIGAPCLRLRFSPDWGRRSGGDPFGFHALNPATGDASVRFLEALADLRHGSRDATVPPTAAWPFACAEEDPLRVVAIAGPGWQSGFARLGLTPMPLPSARCYRELLRQPPPVQRLEVRDAGTLLIARPAAEGDPPAGVLLIWRDPARSGQADAFLDSPAPRQLELDLRYAAEHRFLAVSPLMPAARVAKGLAALARACPGAAGLPLHAVLCDPAPADLAVPDWAAAKRLAVLLPDSAELAPLLPPLQRAAGHGVRLQVLVASDSPERYEALLRPVDPAARAAFFAPFHARGQSADMSLRQQLLDAALAFMSARAARP